MHDNDSVGGSDHRWPEDIARMSDAFVHTAERDLLGANVVVARIEQNHAQGFLMKRAHLGRQQFVNKFRGIELLAQEPLVRETLTELKRRHQMKRFGGTDPANLLQLLDRASAQARERFVFAQ